MSQGLRDKLIRLRNRLPNNNLPSDSEGGEPDSAAQLDNTAQNTSHDAPANIAQIKAIPAGQAAQAANEQIEEAAMPLSRKIFVGIIGLAIMFGFYFLMEAIVRLNAAPQDRSGTRLSLAVMVDRAVQEDVVLAVQVQGESRPRVEIDLVPQVGGQIVYVSPNFIEGGIFKRGETLIRIEPADYRANVVREQSAVAQAEQLLVREIAESEIAREDYAELGTGTPSALALREPQRAQAEAALSAAKAQLETANLQLQRTEVRAPFDGRVRTKAADIGQFVSPGARLGSIFSTDIAEVRLALSDTDLSKLDIPIAFVAKDRASAPTVRLSAEIGGVRRDWDGKIMRTDSSYDPQTRAIFAIAEVFDPYGKGAAQGGVPLAPGLYVDALITGKNFEDVITFKRDGLRPGNEVFVVDDTGQATIRQTHVLDTNEERAVIASGVQAGELIVVSPLEKSRVSNLLEAIDVNDPTITLVKPDTTIPNVRGAAPKAPETFGEKAIFYWRKVFPENPDKLSRSDHNDLINAMGSEYARILRELTEEEENDMRKMSDNERAIFIANKITQGSGASGRGGGGPPNGGMGPR